MKDRIPFRVNPMLATLVPRPFHRPGWVYEEKYDGYRILAYKEGERVRLLSRNGNDRTATFPRIADAVRGLAARTLLLDGEAVAFDRHNMSRFQLLQEQKGEVFYAAFDCLYRSGQDLRSAPLKTRRAALESEIGSGGVVFVSRRIGRNGFDAFEIAKRKGFEGVVGKDASSPYNEGRSKQWLKVKAHKEEEFIIAGFTRPAGSRQHIGALLLGAYEKGELRFVGKVGTGFSQQTLTSLSKRFQRLIRKRPTLVDPPRERDITYLAPKLVAQIAFQEWTADRKLRQPVFLGLRDDKKPEEVLLPEEER